MPGGELTETINGVGGRTRFEYDVRGRLVRITDAVGGVTTRSYTATNQVDSVADSLGRVTTATYDPAGRQLSQTDPDGHTTTLSYGAAGREASTSVGGKLVAAMSAAWPAAVRSLPTTLPGTGSRSSMNWSSTGADNYSPAAAAPKGCRGSTTRTGTAPGSPTRTAPPPRTPATQRAGLPL